MLVVLYDVKSIDKIAANGSYTQKEEIRYSYLEIIAVILYLLDSAR